MFFSNRIRQRLLFALATLLSLHSSLFAADRIRIGYTSPGPQHGLLWLGDTAGLFKKNNLDLEIIYMPGNISSPSLMSGEIQFGQMTGALMSPIRLQGGDPVMLVSVQELLDDRLVVRPNIKTAGNIGRCAVLKIDQCIGRSLYCKYLRCNLHSQVFIFRSLARFCDLGCWRDGL